jgi:hypothetical protein
MERMTTPVVRIGFTVDRDGIATENTRTLSLAPQPAAHVVAQLVHA